MANFRNILTIAQNAANKVNQSKQNNIKIISGKTYTVKDGDNLWNIAKANNISFDEITKLNPTKTNIIHTGDIIKISPDEMIEEINVREERLREQYLNKDNISAIQGYKHNDNYVIIDKKNRKLNIYDKNNNLLYSTNDFATGASGNDYNTITYEKDGKIVNNAGNNSTPAGILEISGKGTYHGYPSFTRARINRDGTKEDVASSLHWGNIGKERNASNGCVRIGGKTLCNIEPYLSTGTRVYTLPEQEGSRFSLKGGRLNFTADNPYGISLTSQNAESKKLKARVKEEQEKYKEQYGENWKEKYDEDYHKRFWDDYNINIDKSYSPLKLKWTKTGNKEYDDNRKDFAQSIVNNKKQLQQKFGLTSDEYNHLAELALGIAEQESKFGTSSRYKTKDAIPDWMLSIIKYVSRGNSGARSRGYTQIKNKSDIKELQEIYKQLGINNETIGKADKSAIATIARLAYMYNNEVKGRIFKNKEGITINPYHALLYKWNGKNSELINKTATPDKNEYIRNVNNYSRAFDLYETRTRDSYKHGGRITLEDI